MLKSLPTGTAQPYRALRWLSTTNARYGHYETLSIPKNASKVTIKSSFYKLSKKYHPDVNANDKGAKEKFQAVNEAYSILGDERRRRAYDRELAASTSCESTSSRTSQTPRYRAYYYDPSSMYESRRRGVSYAWENARRTRTRTSHQPPPPFTQHSYGGTHRSGAAHSQHHDQPKGPDPFSSVHVRRATGRRTPFETREDRLKREPGAVRVVQVLGLVFFIVVLSGGFHSVG